jgi:hypothetical protein
VQAAPQDIETKLRDAAATRNNLLRQVAVDAHDRVEHAKHVAQAERAAAAALADSRLKLFNARLTAAAARREQHLREFSAAHAGRSPGAFLRANVLLLERCRQQGALRRLQVAWRTFARMAKPTTSLVRAFKETTIPGIFVPVLNAGSAPASESVTAPGSHTISGFGNGTGMAWQRSFDSLSSTMQSPVTLQATHGLLKRLEALLDVMHGESSPDCSLLLKRLFPRAAKAKKHIARYPVRMFLCAYMVHAHPDTLFNGANEWEDRLLSTAEAMLRTFEALIAHYLCPSEAASPSAGSIRNQLKLFDEAWVDFLEIFSTWKGEDAASIEADLVRIAVDMQSSMLAAIGNEPASAAANPQLAAIVAQVEHDQALLRTRLGRLRGSEGLRRFDAAVAAAEPSVAARRASLSPAHSTISTPRGVPTRSRQALASGAASSASHPQTRIDERVGPGNLWTARSSLPTEQHGHFWAMPDSTATAAPGDAARQVGAKTTPTVNEMLFHQLLLNPFFQLPTSTISARWSAMMTSTGERMRMPPISATATPAALQQHIAMVAQEALVDSALLQLATIQDGATTEAIQLAMRASFGQVLAIVSELAREVFEMLPEDHPSLALCNAFELQEMEAMLEVAASLQAAVVAVAGLLDKTATLLLEVPVHATLAVLVPVPMFFSFWIQFSIVW